MENVRSRFVAVKVNVLSLKSNLNIPNTGMVFLRSKNRDAMLNTFTLFCPLIGLVPPFHRVTTC